MKDDGDRPLTLAEFRGEMRRRTRRSLWAFGLVVVMGAIGLYRTEAASTDAKDAARNANQAVAASTAEGKTRRKAVGGIIRIFCSVNNEQNQILAQLLAVSIQGAANRHLSGQRLRALRLFTRTQHVLEGHLSCDRLVRRFQRGLPVPPPPDPLRKLLTAGIAALLPSSSPPSSGSGTAATPPPGTATAPQARITPTAPAGATTPSPPPTATEPSGGSGGRSGGGGGGSEPPPPSPPPKPQPPPPDCIINAAGVCVPNPLP